MSLRAALVAALLLPAAVLPAAEPPPAVAEVAGLLSGRFVSRDAGASVRFSVAAVPKSRIAGDAPVFYLEAVKAARPDAPFLQRFLKLEADGARVAVRVYEARDLAGVRGKWREPEALSLFTARDVRERPDCRVMLAKAPAGHWTGGTAAATCASASAGAPLAVTMSVSPQTLEWREEGKDAAGKTVRGPAGEITIYGREREDLVAAAALAAPVPGGAPAVLTVFSPSSPSKKFDRAELRAVAGEGSILLARLIPEPNTPAASIVVVTSRTGSTSVFSFAEVSSSSGPSLDLSGAAPRLVAPAPRALDDITSIELRDLAPAKP